jgi:RNA polymerase sigma-70 factor (ECF subfamily)
MKGGDAMSESQAYDAFSSRLVAVQRRLYSYILTLVPSLTDADDILQETNAVLLRKRNEFEPNTEFGAWACRVAYFEVLSYRRRKQRQRARMLISDEQLLDRLSEEATERYADDESVPIAKLERCMGKLSPLYQELLGLRYRQNQSSEQIAADMGRSASAIRQLLYRIRTQLLTCLRHEQQKEEHV